MFEINRKKVCMAKMLPVKGKEVPIEVGDDARP